MFEIIALSHRPYIHHVNVACSPWKHMTRVMGIVDCMEWFHSNWFKQTNFAAKVDDMGPLTALFYIPETIS